MGSTSLLKPWLKDSLHPPYLCVRGTSVVNSKIEIIGRFLSSLISDMAVRTGIVGLLLVLVGLAFASAVSIGSHTPGP